MSAKETLVLQQVWKGEYLCETTMDSASRVLDPLENVGQHQLLATHELYELVLLPHDLCNIITCSYHAVFYFPYPATLSLPCDFMFTSKGLSVF